jgi:hypothetical protein
MNDEAKHIQISWRRRLFGFHLLIWLVVRLAIGSIGVMPPEIIYRLLDYWALLVAGHAGLLAFLDGRDQADPPLRSLNRLVEPRERRWLLLAIDGLLWIMVTMMIASRVIPEAVIYQSAALIALAWLALTAVGIGHLWLVLFAEIRDYSRTRSGKRKRDEQAGPHLDADAAPLADDGELTDFAEDILKRQQKR